MEHYIQSLLDMVFPIINFILLSLVGAVLSFIAKYIHGKDKRQKAKSAIKNLDANILTTVKSLEAQLRPKLSDGKLTEAEAQQMKKAAIAAIVQTVSSSSLKFVNIFVDDVMSYISNKIEEYVSSIKTHKIK